MSAAFVNPLARNGASVINSARSIKSWARQLLALPDEAVVTVSELACHVPGCPPKETVILVMQDTDMLQVSIHMAMKDVSEQDLAHAFSDAVKAKQ
ncbi:hypothetical protein C8J35_111127 [Rhizobium sp. PP-F2F-G38]|uniref:Nitrate reductase n=1 Tax=Ferranicluibacter rubi TaxID=2715133 RepID=A0AA43ZJ02_9HYPH|nr:hypothetical protein [Ferranicluibacter rubi]NHT78539.1 hypothetical protein [Ferranicluibacter rubi]PYE94071.1 hypothetical protein C8J35_111127 [Rhizobium sp. PP-F2F-G38]TCQ01924.1 hypothetical protein C8J34_12410 [Rhizobium sp. PP-F2F-G36]TCQ20065.1 hypothetical protein C8J33_10833 [Rhizobium sp. PP-CC-3G-465]